MTLRCDCQASVDGLFLDRHESHCAVVTGMTQKQRDRAEERKPQPSPRCFAPGHIEGRPLPLFCSLPPHSGDEHVTYYPNTHQPLWQWTTGHHAHLYERKTA